MKDFQAFQAYSSFKANASKCNLFLQSFSGQSMTRKNSITEKSSFEKSLGNTTDNNPTLGEKELSSLKKTI